MEHRWSLRKRLTTNVLLYHHGIPVARCESRDVGLEGMFVNTGPLNYFRNTRLDVEFSLRNPATGQVARCRLPAIVVHTSNQGLGLTFIGFNPDIFRTLDAILHGPATRARTRRKNTSAPHAVAAG